MPCDTRRSAGTCELDILLKWWLQLSCAGCQSRRHHKSHEAGPPLHRRVYENPIKTCTAPVAPLQLDAGCLKGAALHCGFACAIAKTEQSDTRRISPAATAAAGVRAEALARQLDLQHAHVGPLTSVFRIAL